MFVGVGCPRLLCVPRSEGSLGEHVRNRGRSRAAWNREAYANTVKGSAPESVRSVVYVSDEEYWACSQSRMLKWSGPHHGDCVEPYTLPDERIVSIASMGCQILASTFSGIFVYRMSDMHLSWRWKHHDYSHATAVCASNSHVFTGNHNGSVAIRSISAEGPVVKWFRGHTNPVYGIAMDVVHPGWFATASSDRSVKVWSADHATREALHDLKGHTKTVNCVDMRLGLVATGSRDGTVRMWDLRLRGDKQIALMVCNGSGEILSIGFDDLRIVSGTDKGIVKLWDLRTMTAVKDLIELPGAVTSLKFTDSAMLLGDGAGYLHALRFPYL